jgi:hypothetical protein
MKTPRQLLFDKHRDALPALDEARREALAAIFPPPRARFIFARIIIKLWAELIAPSRKAWAGIAAVWIFIFGFGLALTIDTPAAPVNRIAVSRDMILALRQQNLEFNELTRFDAPEKVSAPDPAEPPRQKPQPRSCLKPSILAG